MYFYLHRNSKKWTFYRVKILKCEYFLSALRKNSPPPSKWSQYPYDLVRFHNCPNIMKCDQLPPLRFFLSQIHPPPPEITHIRTVNFNKLKHFSKCNSKYNKYIVHCYYDNIAGKKINP